MDERPNIKGRGAQVQPANPYLKLSVEDDWEQLEHDADFLKSRSKVPTEFFVDSSKSIFSKNNSPDLPFRYSVNPYRGCEHGCVYCYARPTHEYLGLSGGVDFESKIFVKLKAADLLREQFCKSSWRCEPIMFSGVTDCYQPAERQFKITRSCIEVCHEACQPVSLITKNRLVTRDIDLWQPMAERNTANIAMSITSLDKELAHVLEPRTSSPEARLTAIRELTAAGVPVFAMVAPVILGLNDHEIPSILEAVRDAGALSASYTLLRLPGSVEPVFIDWLQNALPDAYDKVVGRLRDSRGGELNDARFGSRMRGEGVWAEQTSQTFRLYKRKLGLDQPMPSLDCDQFRPPASSSGQLRLF